MGVRRQMQFLVDQNPSEFDNQFGGSRVGEPYDGSRPYSPFNRIGITTDSQDMGGGGGVTYTPPTPPNTTFVPPSNRQELLNGNIIINLLAESTTSAEKISAEFLENDISKGISNTARIVYSPAITFGGKKTYKANSTGKLLTNYYEIEIVKEFISSNYPFDDVIRWRPGTNDVVPDPNTFGIGRTPYWNQSLGTYDFSFDFNRGNLNTPFTRMAELYSEEIQVREYELQDDGSYALSETNNYKSANDVINLTFYFKEKKVGDIPIEPIPVETLSETEYEISFATNLGLEVAGKIFLEYSIESSAGDVVKGGKISVEDGSDIDKINYTDLINGKVRIGVTGNLSNEYNITSVYQNKLVGLDTNNPIDFTNWKTVPQQFEIPISDLKYGVGVIVEISKAVAINSPTITIPQTKFDVQVKESDLEKGLRIPFKTDRADTVIAYINKDKSVQVNASDNEITLYFQKDFQEIYGSKKIIIVANSRRFGTSTPVEVIIVFSPVNDFPSITEINYPQLIDVPSFSDLNVDINVTYNTFAATSVDIDLRKSDGSLINIFKNLGPNSAFKINVNSLNNIHPYWNAGDNKLKLVLKPYNRSGAENLIGNEYEIVTELTISKIQLDETVIETVLMQAFFEKSGLIVPEQESKYLTHLLNFGNNEQILISSWEEDNWTLSEKAENSDGVLAVIPDKEVKSLILKLYSPLPPNITVNSTSWITKLMTNPLVETVVLTEEIKLKCPPIKGPNFNIEVNFVQGQSTSFESLDEILLSGSSTNNQLSQSYLANPLIDWSNLNIEYTSGSNPLNGYLWNNFVHYSSAKERLDNFVYKVQLIEAYERLITSASTNYTGNGSAYTASVAGVYEIQRQNNKKNTVIQSFDGFENFLFNSSSLSWPHSASLRYSSTSSQVINWYSSASISAVEYDNNNANYVLNNIPEYVVKYEENDTYLLFLSMIGHHFDNIYFYAKSIEKSRNIGYKVTNGVSDKLLFDILKSYSWDPKNLNSNLQLWEYTLGLDLNGNQKFLSPSKKRNYEIWRRILNNLPYLLKHRGTRRGIYALLSCYGIPSSNLSIIEFGGPEVDTSKKGKLVMDEMTYVLNMPTSSTISVSWPTTENSRTPDSLEIFFKPTYSGSTGTLLSNTWNLQASASNALDKSYGKIKWNYGAGTLTSNEFPLFSDYYTAVHLSKRSGNVIMDIAQYYGDRAVFTQSLSTAGTWATTTGTVTVGSSGFSGLIDEIRMWSQPLSSSVFFEHAAWPEMIHGNDYSASTNDLFFRLDFEYPKNLYTYNKLLNVDTNVFYDSGYTRNEVELATTPTDYMNSTNSSSPLTATANSFPNITTYPYQFQPYDRSISAPTPSIGASRFIGNKIRFESQALISQLSPKYRSTIKSFDKSPADSNRIGLFFSPNKELNLDIIKSFGGLNFDNYIGDPSDTYQYRYIDLDELREYYFQRYINKTRDIYQYINLIKLYEKALFEDIKQMLPARSKSTTGLLIEPHFLERSKYQHIKPTGDHSDYSDTIDLKSIPNLISESDYYDALIETTDEYSLSGQNQQEQTVIDANYSENLESESYQLESEINANELFSITSLSETGYLESAVTNISTNLGDGTLQNEREAFPNMSVAGQNEISELGFGVYAQDGYAVRSYFNRFGGVSKERVLVSILKEKKEREYTYYQTGDDPRSGELKGTEVYYETRVNIQPFYLPSTTTPSSLPTTNDRIVEVTPVRGYLPTHYKNTSDLTHGLENSYWRGCKNTANTTLDGTPPVEIFATNPNTLRVNKAGRDAAEPILEVE
jgi:hypothetical protein